VHAQTKPVGLSTENRSEVNENLSNNFGQLIGVELKLDKIKGITTVKVSESKSLYDNIKTSEDKMKLRFGLEALERLNDATSFLEVISISSGNFLLESHETLSTDKEFIHYFILRL
jgi:hypothetical protein